MAEPDNTANQEQEAYWQEQAGPKWAEHADRMDRRISHLGQAAMDLLSCQAGDRILDIGCGCGATSFDLAERLGRQGQVTGADISDVMLDVARGRAAERQVSQVEFVRADVQTHQFGQVFDIVFSRFGVMFFEAPDVAFRNISAHLRPAGKLAFTCWQLPRENPWLAVPLGAVGEIVEMPPPPDPHAPGPFSLADPDRISALLKQAGFENLECTPLQSEMKLGNSIEEATQFYFEIGPLSTILADVTPDVKQQCIEALQAAIAPYSSDSGVALPTSTWLVSANL